MKKLIAHELLFKESMTDVQMLTFCELKKGTHTVNFKKIEGNRTNSAIFKAFEKILEVPLVFVRDHSFLRSQPVDEHEGPLLSANIQHRRTIPSQELLPRPL